MSKENDVLRIKVPIKKSQRFKLHPKVLKALRKTSGYSVVFSSSIPKLKIKRTKRTKRELVEEIKEVIELSESEERALGEIKRRHLVILCDLFKRQ